MKPDLFEALEDSSHERRQRNRRSGAEKANDRDLRLLSACCKRQRDRPAEDRDGGTSPHMHVPHATIELLLTIQLL
jgi:hypothetical protein